MTKTRVAMDLTPAEVIMVTCARNMVADDANTPDGVNNAYLYIGLFAERFDRTMVALDKIGNVFKEVGMENTMLACTTEDCGAPVLLEFKRCKVCNASLLGETDEQGASKATEEAQVDVQQTVEPIKEPKPKRGKKAKPEAVQAEPVAAVESRAAPKVEKVATKETKKVKTEKEPEIDMKLFPSPDQVQAMDFGAIKKLCASHGVTVTAAVFKKMSALRAYTNKLLEDKLAALKSTVEPEIEVEEPAPESETGIKFNDADVEREAATEEEEEKEPFDFSLDEVEDIDTDTEAGEAEEEEEEWE
jgi:hypothetical protein